MTAARRRSTRTRRYDYVDGHRETVTEFLQRGGTVTRIPNAWSRHLTETSTLLTILCGGTDEDDQRGFAWADLTPDLRGEIQGVLTRELE